MPARILVFELITNLGKQALFLKVLELREHLLLLILDALHGGWAKFTSERVEYIFKLRALGQRSRMPTKTTKGVSSKAHIRASSASSTGKLNINTNTTFARNKSADRIKRNSSDVRHF